MLMISVHSRLNKTLPRKKNPPLWTDFPLGKWNLRTQGCQLPQVLLKWIDLLMNLCFSLKNTCQNMQTFLRRFWNFKGIQNAAVPEDGITVSSDFRKKKYHRALKLRWEWWISFIWFHMLINYFKTLNKESIQNCHS